MSFKFNPLGMPFDIDTKLNIKELQKKILCSIMVKADYTEGEVPKMTIMTSEKTVLFKDIDNE